jgi:N6-adenosine-specific RNA methylase IME4
MLNRLSNTVTYFESGPFAGLQQNYFKIAYIDPPWQFKTWSHRGEGKGASQHYQCQSLADIMALPVGELMLPDSAIFLWVVQPMYPEAMQVLDAWGFTYRTVAFNWIKMPKNWSATELPLRIHPRMGLGYHTRSGSELCWLAIRGKGYRRRNDGQYIEQVLHAPIREHSRKPDEVVRRIDQLVGDVPRIELFARERRPGWTSWGLEIDAFTSIALPIPAEEEREEMKEDVKPKTKQTAKPEDAVTKPASQASTETTAANPFLQYGKVAAGRNFIGTLLKFNKFGEYVAGQEKEEIAPGTKCAAHMSSLSIGWQRWEDGKPVDTIMGLVVEGFVPPLRSDLGFHDKSQWDCFDDGREKDPWAFTNTLVLTTLDDDEPQVFTFTTTSNGGISALGKLALNHGQHQQRRPDEVPVIELRGGSYTNKKSEQGRTCVPIFKVVDRMPVDELPSLEDVGLIEEITDDREE